MYNELLKQHKEILKKLTEKASKETGFDERGQFMNLQKMIEMEIRFIKNLNEIIEEYSDTEDTIRNSTKQIEEVEAKKHDKYVYAYSDTNNIYKLLYIYNNVGRIYLENVRSFTDIESTSDAISVATEMGFFPIIKSNDFKFDYLTFCASGKKFKAFNTNYYGAGFEKEPVLNFQKIMQHSKIEISEKTQERSLSYGCKIQSRNNLIIDAIDSFNPENIKFDSCGNFEYAFNEENPNEKLLKEIIFSTYLIEEDNNK